MTISGTGATVSADFNVDVNITHTYIGDLIVYLQSPQGTIIYLHLRSGGSADNLIGNYPHTLTPATPLSDLLGQPLDGTWLLFVRDGGNGGTGAFNYWAMYDITGFNCDSGGLTGRAGRPAAEPLRARAELAQPVQPGHDDLLRRAGRRGPGHAVDLRRQRPPGAHPRAGQPAGGTLLAGLARS